MISLKYYCYLAGFEVPSMDILYAILCKCMMQFFFIFSLLIGLLIIFDYLLLNFSSENNIHIIYNDPDFTSILDSTFVLYLSLYIISMMIMSIGFVYHLLGDMTVFNSEYNDTVISLVASQWSWDTKVDTNFVNSFYFTSTLFSYEESSLIHDYTTWGSEEFLIFPKGYYVYIIGSSRDVIHSFGVNAAGIKFDCIPGRTQTYKVIFNQEGSFNATCYELCGAGHAYMRLSMEVVNFKDFFNLLGEKEIIKYTN